MPEAATNADPRRLRLIATLQADDVYGFLNGAAHYLRDVPNDPGIHELTVKSFAALGLASAARGVLEQAPLDGATANRLEQLIPPRDERVPWSKLKQRFDANLAAFDRRTGLGQTLAREWAGAAGKLQLFRCRDGNPQIFSRLPARSGWLPALAPHNRQNLADLEAQARGKIVPPLAVNGLGLGHVPLHVVRATRAGYLDYRPAVFLIEPTLTAWAVVLHLHDWREILADQRVRICAGPGAAAAFDAELENADQAPPLVISGLPRWPQTLPDEQIRARVKQVRQTRTRSQQELFQRFCTATADRDRPFWADRFANAGKTQPPLTILGITSRYTTVLQHSMRDVLAAFERIGCKTHLYIEPDSRSNFSPIQLLRDMERLEPDLIFVIDHLQHEYPNLFPPNIPGVCWIQDQLPHLFRKDAGARVKPLEFVIGHGLAECVLEFGYPAERFFPCIVPTNPDKLRDPHERDADLEPYRCDVMYVSNHQCTPAEFHAQSRQQCEGHAQALLDAAYEDLTAVMRAPWFCGDYDYAGLLERSEQRIGIRAAAASARNQLINILRTIADRNMREVAIRAAGQWADQTGGRFHLYGRGWDQHPEFARFAKGPLEHGVPLGRAFRGAKISLHAGCNSALHQRVLDGLCAGAFFLIQERPYDNSHDVSKAIYEFYQRTNPALPFRVKPDDLPEPQAAKYRRGMLMRGVDPELGDLNGEDNLLLLKLHCEGRGLHTASSVWPRYEQVLFCDPKNLIERIDHFANQPDERRQLAAEMRQAVLERFTYDALVGQVVSFIHNHLQNKGL